MKKLFFCLFVLYSGLIASEKKLNNLNVQKRKTVREVVVETFVTTTCVLPFVTFGDALRLSFKQKESLKVVFPHAVKNTMRESPLYGMLCLIFYATKHMPRDF